MAQRKRRCHDPRRSDLFGRQCHREDHLRSAQVHGLTGASGGSQNVLKNRLEVDRHEFARAMKTFNVRSFLRSAMLAFEGGFLSIEAGNVLVTMRANGQWQGRARFSANLLKALALVAPTENPVVVLYQGERLRIGGIVLDCKWEVVSKVFIKDATRPSPLDLVAMDQTLPRSEIHGTGLAKRIAQT